MVHVSAIVALRGAAQINLLDWVPTLSRHKLFQRDCFTCAYGGQRLHAAALPALR